MMLQRSRPESCLSDLALDRLLAGELASEREAAVREHLGDCGVCGARMASLTGERAAFRAAVPPLPIPRRRARSWAWPAAAAALAMAAALLFWIRVPRGDGDPEPGTRIKGGNRLEFFVKRGATVAPGASGDAMHAGDEVRFRLTARSPGFAIVASIDSAGQFSLYHPAGDSAAPIAAGTTLVPGTIQLDDTAGTETVYAFFCADRIPVAAVRAALDAGDPSLAGCEVDPIRWDKRPE